MPRIKCFMYSESVQKEMTPFGPKTHIVAPLLNILPQFVPGTFSFSVTFIIQEIEGSNHTLRYVFNSPIEGDSPLIDTGETRINVIDDPSIAAVPDHVKGINVSLEFPNIIFRYQGEYYSEVFLNGLSLGRYPIDVYGRGKVK